MSTKGASKQRRDLINNEISQLRELLPLAESARQRLSQLQIMSLTCCFIRKSNYFTKLFESVSGTTDSPFEFFQAMSGFLLVTTKEGKLLYISENVTEFLGHSMVDMMTQGDSLYDIIDKRDHSTVQNELLQGNYSPAAATSEEHTFFCRMNVSRSLRRQGGFGDHKVMHVRGHFLQPGLHEHFGNQPVFMACVSPLVTPDVKETIIQNNTMIFQSVHGLDMKYMEVAKNGEHHLGYREDEMVSTSWYSYLHPEDIMEAKEKHSQLIKASHEMGCMLTVRLMNKDASWIWMNIVMHIRQPFTSDSGEAAIVCINHIIEASEASHFKLQSQLYSSHIARSPEFLTNPVSSSPPHTITQVPMESDQYPSQGYATDGAQAHSSGYYQAEFGVTLTPIGSSSSGQMGSSMDQKPVSHSRISTLSDNSSDSFTMQSKKTMSRAELMERLKRKLPQQCKPSKKPKLAVGQNTEDPSPRDDLNFFGSVVSAPYTMFGNLTAAEDVGGNQMLVQVSDRPVFAQLKKNIDLKVKDPELLMSQAVQNNPASPLGPLTPDSIMSDYGGSNIKSTEGTTMLTVDTSGLAMVPESILTPEASPANSPHHATTVDDLKEQCVPSFLVELESMLKETQTIHSPTLKVKPMMTPKQSLSMKPPAQQLPELDALTIDSFFGELESITQDLDIPLPEGEAWPSVPNEAKPVVSSSESSPVPSPEKHEEVHELSELELANIVASAAESIMEMVQLQNGSTQTHVMADFAVIPSSLHTGCVSGMVDSPEEQGFAEVPEVKLEPAEEENTMVFAPEELMNELHQLNQLAANSAPSYGEPDLVDAFWNQTL